jgi:hypothetical protein
MTDDTNLDTASLPQGSLRLLETAVARELLASTIPARVAYVAKDGTPRVIATWFHWTGEELVMPTFIAAPHVKRQASRLASLRARPEVAVTIDTDSFPPRVLTIRGKALITEVDGIASEYAASAKRYLGEEAAAQYLASIDQPGTRMARIAVQPAWAGVVDFQARMPQIMTL